MPWVVLIKDGCSYMPVALFVQESHAREFADKFDGMAVVDSLGEP